MNSHELDIVKILLESNLFNFLVVTALILYFLPKVHKIFVLEKRDEINSKSAQYEDLKQKHEEKLHELEEKVRSLKTEADTIVKDAEKAAISVRKQIIDSAHKEIEQMKELAFKDIEAHKKRAHEQVKEQFVAKAAQTIEDKFLAKIQDGEDTKHIMAFKSLEPMHKS